MSNMKKDVFICHASEDKINIIRPLIEGFDKNKISYWFDEADIKWGDSLTGKVNEGLRISKYVLVVLSPNFILKPWPEREFYAALNMESSSGEVKVLPLLVGSEKEKKEILERYPLINDKKYLPWDLSIDNILSELLSRLEEKSHKLEQQYKEIIDFDLPPKIKKKFSTHEKDIFLKEAFEKLREYFQNTLKKMDEKYTEIQTDFIEIHKFKFICKIYINGELKNQCKIWLGGLTSSDSIAYAEGKFDINNDNSINDFFVIEISEYEIGFKLSNMWFDIEFKNIDLLDKEQLSRYIWKRFIKTII
ncbi:MAG: toll/interleukin-1 receptor domain-containing protein [Actinobacteria bacterium]|nr:toll/interleukin-1 receptor domain-containing protein [Actinomycetota bacterium]